MANLGELICSVNGEHRWNDAQSFLNEKPKMKFAVALPKAAPQQGHVPIQLTIPPGLKAALEAKYGSKTDATMASILMQMVEGNVLVVGQTDLDRLGSHLGKIPESSGELYGMIYAKTEEVAEAKMIAEAAAADLKAYEGLSPGRIVIDLGDQHAEAVARARNMEPPLPLSVWAAKVLKDGIANNWF